MAETVAGDVVVADLDHELRLQRLPFAGALGAPAARAARRVAGEAGRRAQRLELARSAPTRSASEMVDVKPT